MKAAGPETAVGPARAEEAPRPFAELLRAHQAMVFSVAYHFLHDRAAAEEIAQDVFLELYRRLNDLKTEAHVAYWLRKVTSNRCIDYVRKRKLRAAVPLDDAPEPSTVDQREDVLMNRKLQNLVACLPEKARAVVILRYQEDLMPDEIAKILDIPAGTVKSHLHRSLALLREKIGRSLGEVR